MTPGETGDVVEAMSELSRERQKDGWRRTAYLCAAVMNSSGNYKRVIKPEQLMPFDEGGSKRLTAEEREERKREAQETLRMHKAKFWTKFKDESVAKLTGE
jgi:hypothetical protein